MRSWWLVFISACAAAPPPTPIAADQPRVVRARVAGEDGSRLDIVVDSWRASRRCQALVQEALQSAGKHAARSCTPAALPAAIRAPYELVTREQHWFLTVPNGRYSTTEVVPFATRDECEQRRVKLDADDASEFEQAERARQAAVKQRIAETCRRPPDDDRGHLRDCVCGIVTCAEVDAELAPRTFTPKQRACCRIEPE